LRVARRAALLPLTAFLVPASLLVPIVPIAGPGNSHAAPALVHQKVGLGPDARQASIAVEPGGRVWIAYLNLREAGVLEVLRRETSGAWQMDSVQAVNPGSGAPSLVLSASGSPNIAYSSCCGNEIGLITRSGSVWSIELPVANASHLFGRFPALALQGGEPRILYGEGLTVVLATKSGTTWSKETVNPGNGAHLPFSPRLRYGGDGSRHALFLLNHPTLGGTLRHSTGTPWVTDSLRSVESQGSFDLVLDGANKPNIAYVGRIPGGVWYAKKDPGWTYEVVDSFGTGGLSLALGPGGVPHIVYRKDGALWLGTRSGGGWTREPLTSPGLLEFHYEPDLTFDGAGKMHLVYSEEQITGEWHLVYAGEGGFVSADPPVLPPAAGAGTTPAIALGAPWPNPSRGALTVRLVLTREESVGFEIYDPAGRRVAERAEQTLPAGEHVIPWSADGLSPGLYFVRARGSSGAHATRPFVVAR
jgi:hypothetical protein